MLPFIVPALLLLAGFVIVIKGADILIDGAVAASRKLHVPYFIIGLTVIAFGTSAPELFVNAIAAYKGSGTMALANVVGSNISNILLVLGVTVVIIPVVITRDIIYKDIFFNFLATGILLGWLVYCSRQPALLNIYIGIGLLLLFIVFLALTALSWRKSKLSVVEEHSKPMSLLRSLLYISGGFIALAGGGELIVRGATGLADLIGVGESVIGLSIVALGTSVPELAASVAAALKNKPDIAVGNVLGSNIFNILWVLSISSIIASFNYTDASNLINLTPLRPDLWILLAALTIILVFAFTGKFYYLKRWQGVIFLLAYAAYIYYIIYRAGKGFL